MSMFDGYAQHSYDRLRLYQPKIQVDGLWKHGRKYFVVCKGFDPDTKAADGTLLVEWFARNKVAGCWMELTASPPDGATKLPDRTASQLASLQGEPLSLHLLQHEIDAQTPNSFPRFFLSDTPEIITLHVERELDGTEWAHLAWLMDLLKIPYQVNVESSEVISGHFEAENKREKQSKNPFRHSDLLLVPAKRLSAYAPALRSLYETDQEFWLDNSEGIWTSPKLDIADCLPSDWVSAKSRGLVNAAVFRTHDIRTYLSIYHIVTLIAPLFPSDEVEASLGVSESELIQLAETGRVQICFPQSVERYSPSLVNRLAEYAPQSMLFSRRLAAASICDARRRLPFLYPAVGTDEKSVLAGTFDAIAAGSSAKGPLSSLFHAVAAALRKSWDGSHFSIHKRGAMGTLAYGVGGLFASVLEALTQRDLILESWSAGQTVEWAGALNATAHPVPNYANGYSDQPLVEMLANVYSSAPLAPLRVAPPQSNAMIDNLLSISRSVPVVDFATSFSGGDIDRLRDLLFRMSRGQFSAEEAEDVAAKFNEEVRQYERNKGYLDFLMLDGFLIGHAVGLTEAGPLISHMISMLEEHYGHKRVDLPAVDHVIDYFKALLTLSKPSAVLVARMKRKP